MDPDSVPFFTAALDSMTSFGVSFFATPSDDCNVISRLDSTDSVPFSFCVVVSATGDTALLTVETLCFSFLTGVTDKPEEAFRGAPRFASRSVLNFLKSLVISCRFSVKDFPTLSCLYCSNDLTIFGLRGSRFKASIALVSGLLGEVLVTFGEFLAAVGGVRPPFGRRTAL